MQLYFVWRQFHFRNIPAGLPPIRVVNTYSPAESRWALISAMTLVKPLDAPVGSGGVPVGLDCIRVRPQELTAGLVWTPAGSLRTPVGTLGASVRPQNPPVGPA